MKTTILKLERKEDYNGIIQLLSQSNIPYGVDYDDFNLSTTTSTEILILDIHKNTVNTLIEYEKSIKVATDYKNFPLTILFSFISGFVSYFLINLFLPLDDHISKYVSLLLGVAIFFMIGRKIIVRHIIQKNKEIIVEYKFRPSYKKVIPYDTIENIIFKLNDNSSRLKGIILFKNQVNYHKDYFSFDLNDEIKWFWL